MYIVECWKKDGGCWFRQKDAVVEEDNFLFDFESKAFKTGKYLCSKDIADVGTEKIFTNWVKANQPIENNEFGIYRYFMTGIETSSRELSPVEQEPRIVLYCIVVREADVQEV